MDSKKMEEALNDQINYELLSAYLYMSMSNYSSRNGLRGFTKWFMAQYHEEMLHAMKIYEFVQRRGGTVVLKEIPAPEHEWDGPLDLFEKTLIHEKSVTKRINNLIDIALEERDHASHIFLQWFISEQVEEEENDNDIIAQLKLIGDDTSALLTFDKELGARAVTVPTVFTNGVDAAEKAMGK